MTPIPHKNTFADVTGMAVLYCGENALKQFCFGNGSQLITHVFNTLPEAVERFGPRIAVYGKEFAFSAPYQSGIIAAHAGRPYAPTREHGRQALLEYGAGYIRGLLEKPARDAAKAASAPALPPLPVAPPVPVAPVPTKADMLAGIAKIAASKPVEPEPIKRGRGRPRKTVVENLDE